MPTTMYGDRAVEEGNPALLKPGTFVFLWPPGEAPGLDKPNVAIVEAGRADTIVAENLTQQCRGVYPVSDRTAPGLRWTWELAAPPRRPHWTTATDNPDGVAVEGPMSLCDRVKLTCGVEPGKPVNVRLKSGDIINGVLTRLVMRQPDDHEAEWAEFVGPADSRGQIKHVVRVSEIAAVTRTHE